MTDQVNDLDDQHAALAEQMSLELANFTQGLQQKQSPKSKAKRKAVSSKPGSSLKQKPHKKFKNIPADAVPEDMLENLEEDEIKTDDAEVLNNEQELGSIFKDLENMESIELLTEYLAKRPPHPDGQEVIVGDLVSGYCQQLTVYYCADCKYVFPDEKSFIEHKKVGQCIFICFTCGEGFTFKNYSSYLKHLKSHNPWDEAGGLPDTVTGRETLFMELNPLVPKNTIRVNLCVAEKLRTYLKKLDADEQFEKYDEDTLALYLAGFYEEVRTRDGEMFRVHSFENLRYSLNRYLRSAPFNLPMDIINGPAFRGANASFNAVLSEIREIWKGSTEQHHLIEPVDFVTLYESRLLDPSTPAGLLNRVQMNVRLFFCRQSRDYLEKMSRETFAVDVFPNGKKCVIRQNATINEYMPEDSNNPKTCPVGTFELYLSKLNPACDKLWQVPKDIFNQEEGSWYHNRHIGRDTLGKFMANISKTIPLSMKYTNHSVRLTGNSFYNRMKLTPEQILAATQMKSNLPNYNKEKMKLSARADR